MCLGAVSCQLQLSNCLITVSFVFLSYYVYTTGDVDVAIINGTTLTIDALSNSACLTIEAVDDQIAENTELFNVTAAPSNILDVVNGTTDIYITDNDGMLTIYIH